MLCKNSNSISFLFFVNSSSIVACGVLFPTVRQIQRAGFTSIPKRASGDACPTKTASEMLEQIDVGAFGDRISFFVQFFAGD
jgi:hypothetical protein